MPVNIAGKKKLTGVELAAQSQFSFLPAPFDNLGVVANYYLCGHALGADRHLEDQLQPHAPRYETDRWGVRGSLNHRTRWYSGA